MKIQGIEGMSPEQLQDEIARGGSFVYYQYCVSVIVMTFKRSSDIYFVRGGESKLKKGIQYSLLSALAGWWGIPWGPIYTIGALANNLGGGTVVTREVMNQLQPRAA
jgi:hypothetical protein